MLKFHIMLIFWYSTVQQFFLKWYICQLAAHIPPCTVIHHYLFPLMYYVYGEIFVIVVVITSWCRGGVTNLGMPSWVLELNEVGSNTNLQWWLNNLQWWSFSPNLVVKVQDACNRSLHSRLFLPLEPTIMYLLVLIFHSCCVLCF